MLLPPKKPIDPSKLVPPKKKLAESIDEEVSSKTPATPVAPDAMTPTSGAGSPGPSLPTPIHNPPEYLPPDMELVLGQDGKAYAKKTDAHNSYALPVGCKMFNNMVLGFNRDEGRKLRKSDIKEINEQFQAHAEMAGIRRDVWYRVAPIPDGIEIDLGDAKYTRISITGGKVKYAKGSSTLFYRTPVTLPFIMPASKGDLDLLKKYINLNPASTVLLIAWLTYTLAHPKAPATSYVILILQGDQGSGKSTLCHIIQCLVDPSIVGVQAFPRNQHDFAIGAQASHVLFFDNVRSIPRHLADTLSMAATGSAISTRQLYSDADQSILKLHVAPVLNGIHSFIDQPDLAQRCLQLHLNPLDGSNRSSKAEFINEFKADLPIIFRGLLDLTASILASLRSVKPENPERMFEFSHWLAAMEKAKGVPPGIYQIQYSAALNTTQLDTLLDDPLAAAIYELADNFPDPYGDYSWSGTPTELLEKLSEQVGKRSQYSREWPKNPISLSKRLISIKAGLQSQDINIEFSKGKKRNITISKTEEAGNE